MRKFKSGYIWIYMDIDFDLGLRANLFNLLIARLDEVFIRIKSCY